jgi:DNA-binding LytR/AlgR family response regulator
MLRCIIVDDEPWAIDLLSSYISKIDFLELVHTSENPIHALNYIAEGKVDLVFLDIQMPQLTGIQFMKLLDKETMVIVTTAYAAYAINGYEHDILDYLLKPIEFDRLYKAAQKAKNKLEYSLEVSLPNPQPQRNYIFIKTDGRLVKVNFEQILFIEGLKDYISINTKKGALISLDSLLHMESLLPSSVFVRIQKSYIINIDHVEVIEKNRIFISDKVIPVGEAYKDNLLKALGK